MRSIRSRIETLERDRAQVNLDALSDEELDAYAKSVEFGSPECWAAVLTKVLQHPTTIRVVPDTPNF